MAVLKHKLNRKNESGSYDEIHLKTDATVISLSPTDETLLSDEISSLKSSVSNGKSLIAAAVTDKGVPTAASDSFTTMSNNIRKINDPVPSQSLPEGYTQVNYILTDGKAYINSEISNFFDTFINNQYKLVSAFFT